MLDMAEMQWHEMEEVVRNRLELMLAPDQKQWAANAAHDIVLDIRMEMGRANRLTYQPGQGIITPWDGYRLKPRG
jgi:hypothetical protein